MSQTDAQRRAALKYRAHARENITLERPAGDRAAWKAAATAAGESLAGYIAEAVRRRISADGLEQIADAARAEARAALDALPKGKPGRPRLTDQTAKTNDPAAPPTAAPTHRYIHD